MNLLVMDMKDSMAPRLYKTPKITATPPQPISGAGFSRFNPPPRETTERHNLYLARINPPHHDPNGGIEMNRSND